MFDQLLHRAQGTAALLVSVIFVGGMLAYFLFATRHERKHQENNKDDHH